MHLFPFFLCGLLGLQPLRLGGTQNYLIIFTPLLLLLYLDLSRTYTQDGVCLTESGLCQLQSLSATASRRRKPKPKLKLKIINQNSVAVLQAPLDPPSEHSRDEDMEDNRGTLTHHRELLTYWIIILYLCFIQYSLFWGLCILKYLYVIYYFSFN